LLLRLPPTHRNEEPIPLLYPISRVVQGQTGLPRRFARLARIFYLIVPTGAWLLQIGLVSHLGAVRARVRARQETRRRREESGQTAPCSGGPTCAFTSRPLSHLANPGQAATLARMPADNPGSDRNRAVLSAQGFRCSDVDACQ